MLVQKPAPGMGKTLKVILIFLLGVIATVAIILVPWSDLFLRIGIDPFRTNVPASLQVNCFVGNCNVFVDGQDKGETPVDILDITPGEHTIKLEKSTTTPEFYTTVTKKIKFIRATKVYMEWEIGPSKVFSQGHVLSFKERTHDTEPVLSISSDLSDVDVQIDGVSVGEVPFLGDSKLLKEGSHKITLSKSGYIDQEIEVDINNDYVALLEVDLMALPIKTE
jgi:hypothetical protein